MSLKKSDNREKNLGLEAVEERLRCEINSLKAPISAPHLWERIETILREEKTAESRRPQARSIGYFARLGRALRRTFILVPVASLILAGIFLGVFFGLRQRVAPSGILAREALHKIELKEREYIGAIEELEKKARPKMAEMDLDMVSLYRDKLETINSQIGRCREALASNPANAHIRRYLLAALQDKRQTLAELLAYE